MSIFTGMTRLSISSRNSAGHKHPRSEASGLAISPAVALLYLLGSLAALYLLRAQVLPPHDMWAELVFFAAFQFLLMFLAVPVTAFGSATNGYLSFDRLAIVAAILMLGPVPAAWAAGVAAFAWTLANNIYRKPWDKLITHAIGNGGMFVLSALAAGTAYAALGGKIPLVGLKLTDFGWVCALILVLQIVNELLYFAMIWAGMKPESRRHLVHLPSSFTEIIIAFTGLITVLIFVRLPLAAFALYIALIINVAVLVKLQVRTIEAERRRSHELTAINRVNQVVSASAGLDALIESIFVEIRQLIPFSALVFGLYYPETEEFDIRLNFDNGERHPPSRRKLGESVLGWAIAHRQAIRIADTRSSDHPALRRRAIAGDPAISIMAVPIIYRGETLGLISAQDYHPDAFGKHHLELLESFAAQTAVAIANTRMFTDLQNHQQQLESRVAQRTAELEQTSTSLAQAAEEREALLRRLEMENRRDTLTGLANRRNLEETLRQEHYRARRFGHPLSIALADIDQFKRVNDTWGHLLGDRVLATIADIFRGELRATDFPARYGGEEFLILFPETLLANARTTCENICRAIATHPWETLADGLAVTMSFGVCSAKGDLPDYTELLNDADQALYHAKSEGRNRVST